MKWATHNGLAIAPSELHFKTPTDEDIAYRRTTNHHLYWTKQQYESLAIRHTFRNLVDHVHPLLRREHESLHERFAPPPIPHEGLMVDVIDEYLALHGVINLVREKATNDVYQVSADQWKQTRLNYRSVA